MEQKHIDFVESTLTRLEIDESATGAVPELEPGERFARHAEAEMVDQAIIEARANDVRIHGWPF